MFVSNLYQKKDLTAQLELISSQVLSQIAIRRAAVHLQLNDKSRLVFENHETNVLWNAGLRLKTFVAPGWGIKL